MAKAGELDDLDLDGVSDDRAVELVTYTYDSQGNRASAEHKLLQVLDYGTAEPSTVQTSHTLTEYLVDRNNHTGYAQVLEETSGNAVIDSGDADGDGRTDDFILSPETRIQYTIGDDIISQTTSTYNGSLWTANADGTQCLLYDGHGSTRQLAAPDKSVVDSYDYDAYGVMLGSEAKPADSAATKMLYSGEQYDSSLSQYYLRARYYDQSNGRFTTLDPYSGNTSDPQSLHKYTYCHNDPVNGLDPTGWFFGDGTLLGLLRNVTIMALLGALIGGAVGAACGGIRGAILGAIAGSALGIGLATRHFWGVVRAGLWQGVLSMLIEWTCSVMEDVEEWRSPLTWHEAADLFFSGFAYGAMSAAITWAGEMDSAKAIGAALLAAAQSAIVDLIDGLTKPEGLNIAELLANAIIAFGIAVITNPKILLSAPQSRYELNQVEKAAKVVTEHPEAAKAFLSWYTASILAWTGGMAVKRFIRTVTGQYSQPKQ